MTLDQDMFAKLPPHLKALFVKLPNPGSDEVLAGFPVTGASVARERGLRPVGQHGGYAGASPNINPDSGGVRGHEDVGGSAARFFYCAKSSKADRGEGNNHPTVKPSALMRYLCRLVTPPGGTILDPFAGSGSTGRAADIEGFNAILIELDPAYAAIASKRINGDSPLFAKVEAA